MITLKSLVRMAKLRRTKVAIVGLWVVSFLSMFTWVWESWEVVPGGYEHRANYFEVRRSALFVWFTLIVLGYLGYQFKQQFLARYGAVEVAVGLIGGVVAVRNLPFDSAASWFALLASAYVIVRGAGNVAQGVKEDEENLVEAPVAASTDNALEETRPPGSSQ